MRLRCRAVLLPGVRAVGARLHFQNCLRQTVGSRSLNSTAHDHFARVAVVSICEELCRPGLSQMPPLRYMVRIRRLWASEDCRYCSREEPEVPLVLHLGSAIQRPCVVCLWQHHHVGRRHKPIPVRMACKHKLASPRGLSTP